MASIQATGASEQSVRDVADATKPRTMWRDAELELIAELDCQARGVLRIQRNRLLDVRRTGAVLRKLDAAGGNGTASTVQLARHLYADVGAAWDAGRWQDAYDLAQDKRESIRRWLRVLASQGVIAYTSLPGKGFRWRFLPVPDSVARMASARGCSSVGWSVSTTPHEGRRRQQDAREGLSATRVRRWCPRAGRGSRYEPPPLFSPAQFEAPGALPLYEGKSKGVQTRAREAPDERALVRAAIAASLRSASGEETGLDAVRRSCPASERAALERLLVEGSEGGVAALRAAGLDGAPWTALCLALWWLCFGREPRFSRDAAAQLQRSAGQLERLWDREWLVDRLVAWFEGSAGDPDVHTLRMFAVMLKHEGRECRRRARGKPSALQPWRPDAQGLSWRSRKEPL